MENISAIIIDDEPDAINLMALYLRHYSNITLSGSETNAIKGLALVAEILPDLVFLDIDMPDMNGLQVAASIHSDNFHSEIVFTTAHQHYAYDALGVEPLDFLIKPYSIEDIELVMQKYRSKLEKKKLSQKLEKFVQSQKNLPRLKLPTNHGIVVVDIRDIVFIKAVANKSIIHLQDGTTESINKNIKALVDGFKSSEFFRLTRSVYINLNYLTCLDKKNNTCILSYNKTVQQETISKEQINQLEQMKLFNLSNIL